MSPISVEGARALNSLSGSIVSVQVGRIAALGPKRVPSAFVKQPVGGPVPVERRGLAGDQQADLRVHGGPEKAIYCYPVEHYAKWRAALPSAAPLLVPGGFGENVTTQGLDEDHVCVGDVFRIDGVTAQVTQPRQPCFKLALRFENPQMVKAMVRSGLSGWYLRVLYPGQIEAGALITLLDRPNPTWSITRLNRLIRSGGSLDEIADLAGIPALASDLQHSAAAALDAASRANRVALHAHRI
jgi:MOSC domain-containing protein YiiM